MPMVLSICQLALVGWLGHWIFITLGAIIFYPESSITTIWAICALYRSCDMFSRQFWVDSIVQSSGRVMRNGIVVGCFLIIGAFGRRKSPVVPESIIPWSIGVSISVAYIVYAVGSCSVPLFCCCHYSNYLLQKFVDLGTVTVSWGGVLQRLNDSNYCYFLHICILSPQGVMCAG